MSSSVEPWAQTQNRMTNRSANDAGTMWSFPDALMEDRSRWFSMFDPCKKIGFRSTFSPTLPVILLSVGNKPDQVRLDSPPRIGHLVSPSFRTSWPEYNASIFGIKINYISPVDLVKAREKGRREGRREEGRGKKREEGKRSCSHSHLECIFAVLQFHNFWSRTIT